MTKKNNEDEVILHLSTENHQDSANLSYSSSLKRITESVGNIAKILSKSQYATNSLTPIYKLIDKLTVGLSTQLNWQITKSIETIQTISKVFFDWYSNLPENIKSALDVLGKHGWFYDIDMPFSYCQEIALMIENDKSSDAENILIQYFDQNLNKIETQVNEKFPHRAKIISAAFRAHENSAYELSVPVLLAQADGICFELINQSLFRKTNKNKPQTSIYVDSIITDAFRSALLFPLTESLPISASKKERDENFSELNRHQVLHGEVIDYGTEINSLKSISLLNYVTQVLNLDKN